MDLIIELRTFITLLFHVLGRFPQLPSRRPRCDMAIGMILVVTDLCKYVGMILVVADLYKYVGMILVVTDLCRYNSA